MSIWARLFASPEAVADTVKSAVRGLDDIVYTEQEKAERHEKAQELWSQLWLAAVPSALSRRIIAVTIVGVWALLILAGVLFISLDMVGAAEFAFKALEEVVVQPMNIVVGFYFLQKIIGEMKN